MAGILGDLLGLGGTQAPTPGLLDAAGYMDPAQYDRMRQSQSMMGLWAGLLAGGGPSLSPRNFGSALGAGLTGAQQFGSQFDESQRYRAEAQKNLADITAKKQGFELAKEYLKGGVLPEGTPGSSSPAAPGSGSSTPNFGGDYKGSGDPASLVKHFESGGNYNIGYGGTDLSNAPRDQYGFPQWAGKDNSHAAGAYQFQPGTWAKYAAPLGITDFSQESQDKVFAAAFAKEGWGPWAPYNPRLAAEVARRTSPGAGGSTTPAGAAIPDFTEGRAAEFGGPAPAPAVLTAPGSQPNAPATPGAGAALGTGRTVLPPGRGLVTPQDYVDWQASGRVPSGPVNVGALAGPVNVRPLAGDAAPAEAGPSFGYGSAGERISPAVLAAAAGGAPPVPAVAVPAPPVPAPVPPVTQPPVAAAAPAPGATRPPSGPGEVTVTLPKPPALGEMLPVPAAQPQALPAAPETPGIPARPQIPGATPGAAVSPAVAARARQAQGVVLGLSMMGVHVPDFLQKEAGIEIAGRTAAAEAEAKQPIELQNKAFEASLTAAQKRWDALTDQQKETLAFQRNMTKDQMQAMYSNIHEQYKSLLGLVTAGPIAQAQAEGALPSKLRELTGKTDEELRAAWDKPDKIVVFDAAGNPYTRIATPRQLDAEIKAGGGGVGGVAPTPGILTGVGPQREAELKARGTGLGADYSKIQTDATTARTQIADLKTMQSNAQNLAAQGIFADNVQFANRVINGVTGQQADRVAAYELVTKNSEKLIRDATRQSDSQPAAIQLVMTRNSMPTPSTSVAGFDGVVGQMLGAQQYTVYKQQAAEQWLADPRHNNSLQGFENTLPVSPYAFMVNQMPDSQKAALAERLRSAGPAGAAEAQALAAQIRAAKAAGF